MGVADSEAQEDDVPGAYPFGASERRFRFRTLPQAVGAARRALREWERDFDPTLFYDLSLCVSELVTISVQQRRRDDEEAELAVRRSEKTVRAEVRRRWQRFARAPAASPEREWATFMLDRVADRWGAGSDVGTLLWCEIDLAGDGRSRRHEPVVGTSPSRRNA